MTDFVKNLFDRYRSIDPNYGSQDHQRAFIERCEELQRIAPCSKDHSQDDPPEHRYSGNDACYPENAVRAVVEWQLKKKP